MRVVSIFSANSEQESEYEYLFPNTPNTQTTFILTSHSCIVERLQVQSDPAIVHESVLFCQKQFFSRDVPLCSLLPFVSYRDLK